MVGYAPNFTTVCATKLSSEMCCSRTSGGLTLKSDIVRSDEFDSTAASVGCAYSQSFAELLVWRVVQGFAGGLLIPQVFAGGFVLFPGRGQALATTIAGVLAVLAPTVGPYVGGWITRTYDWPWLFLINVGPGLVAIAVSAWLLPKQRTALHLVRTLDYPALALMAAALASLEIGLKEAPQQGWGAWPSVALFAGSLAAAPYLWAVRCDRPAYCRSSRAKRFQLRTRLRVELISGSGSTGVYLMPVFLAFVRVHDALEIGETMIVTGMAQLIMAPIAVF